MKDGDLQSVVRHCDRKDVSHHPLFKALKALALDRSGMREEALSLCNDALRPIGGRAVTNPRVLSLIAKILRRSGDEQRVYAAYEAAYAAMPESEVLGRELALSLARTEEWKKFQQSALRLNKSTGKPIYALWAAWTINLTTSSPCAEGKGPAPLPLTGGGRRFFCDAPSDSRPLAIAETLLSRALDALPPSERDSEALGLYFHTLVRQGRPGEAYRALHGKYAYKVNDGGNSATDSTKSCKSSEKGEAAKKNKVTASEEDEGRAVGEEEEGEEEEEEDILVSPYPFADGGGGRGKVPSHFQPVDTLRYSAFLLTECALKQAELSSSDAAAAPATSTTAPATPPVLSPSSPSTKVGTWHAALEAYGTLLTSIDSQDWAYHCGLAYCWARGACQTIEIFLSSSKVSRNEKSLEELLFPVITKFEGGTWDCSSSSSLVSGLAGLDNSLFFPQIVAEERMNLEGKRCGMEDAAALKTGANLSRSRGSALSLIQLQAVRCELLHRLITFHSQAQLQPLFITSLASYVHLIKRYVSLRGDLPCCFTDLEPFLLPLLPNDGLQQQQTPPSLIHGFLSSTPSILSMPFSPTADAMGGSDMAPTAPLFTWSFVVPRALTSEDLLLTLREEMASHTPTPELRRGLVAVLVSSKNECILAGERALAAAASLLSLEEPKKNLQKQQKGSSAEAGGGMEVAVNKVVGEKEEEEREEVEEEDDFASLIIKQQSKKGSGGGKNSKGGKHHNGGGKKSSGKTADATVTTSGGGAAAAAFPTPHSAAAAAAVAPPLTPKHPTMESILSSNLPVKKFDKRRPDPSDPHGVRGELFPPSQLSFTSSQTSTLNSTRASVRRFTTSLQLQKWLGMGVYSGGVKGEGEGEGLPLKDLLAFLTTAWLNCLPLITAGRESGGEKDVGECDEILLLAVHALWDAAFDALLQQRHDGGGEDVRKAGGGGSPSPASQARALFIESSVLLTAGSQQSPYNAQFHLAQLKVCGWLGSCTATVNAWHKCRIRHVLLDTLSHLAFWTVGRLCWPEAFKRTWCDGLAGEVVEMCGDVHLPVSLEGGHVSAAVDLLRMRERLIASHQVAAARLGGLSVILTQGACKNGVGECLAALKRGIHGGGGVSDLSTGGGPAGGKPSLSRATLVPPPPRGALSTPFVGSGGGGSWRDNSDRRLVLSWAPPSSGLCRQLERGGSIQGVEPVIGSSSFTYENVLSRLLKEVVVVQDNEDEVRSPLERLATVLRPWAGTRSGGTVETLLRQASSLSWYSLRHALFSTAVALGDGDSKTAQASWEKAREILGQAGFTTQQQLSEKDGLFVTREVRVAMRGDCVGGGGTLPWIDAGISESRWCVREWCGEAIFGFFDAAVAISCSNSAHTGGSDGAGSDSTILGGIGGDDELSTRILAGVHSGSSALQKALNSTFSVTTYPLPDHTTCSPAHPSFFAEGSMLLHSVLPLTNLALGLAFRGLDSAAAAGKGATGKPRQAALGEALGEAQTALGKAINSALSYLNDMKVSLGGTSEKVLTTVTGTSWAATAALTPFLRGEGPGRATVESEDDELFRQGPGGEWAAEMEKARWASLMKCASETLQVSEGDSFLCSCLALVFQLWRASPYFVNSNTIAPNTLLTHTHSHTQFATSDPVFTLHRALEGGTLTLWSN